ncbi:MAG: threonine--tRNA ligase [Trueperaceae bacterium]
MQVILPDGKRLDVPDGATGLQVAQAIGPRLARAALGMKVEEQLFDLLSPIPDGARVAVLTARDEESIRLVRHTLAHLMAQAVREYFVEQGFDAQSVKMGIGPVIENGFYYDFDLPRTLVPDDLSKIEERMLRIVDSNLELHRYELPREEALERYRLLGDPYKVELIEDLPEDAPLSFYQQGGGDGFTDLCRGPHLPRTGSIPKHFKLMSLAGAYWRGDESRPMLQRVYGVAFAKKEELEHHLWQLEEAKKRDHRKLGAELELFTLDEDIGPGLPLWLPRGTVMADEIEALAKEMEWKAGYQRVRTPHVSKEHLFAKSGHLEHYEEDMFPPMELDNVRYFLKPMNCPFHHKIYASKTRSYRELPLRFAEYGTCYRYEDHGALVGLMRVRSLQMNDAHIYCGEEQFADEFMRVIGMYLDYFKLFGIDEYVMRLSKHSKEGLGKKYVDQPELWLKTEDMVRRALVDGGINFIEADDEAAFYGPKIDVQIKSAIGREFTLATNQVDFAQPARFGLEYVDDTGTRRTPLCLHRAPLSTHERLIGFLIEHFAGDFPLWLSPEQVRIVPIADRHLSGAREIEEQLRAVNLRPHVDDRPERMNAKVRDAELMKVPYTLIIGDQELAAGTVSYRSRKEPNRNGVARDVFISHLRSHVTNRALEVLPLAPD